MSHSASESRPPTGPRPWHSLTMRVAIAMTVLGAAFWGFAHASDSANAKTLGPYAPAMLRFGVSLAVGFLIGWMLRRFLKWTLLIVGAVTLGIVILKKTGLINLPWDSIQENVDEGSTWLRTQAGSTKDLLTGYLPSGAAAVVGVFMGMRR